MSADYMEMVEMNRPKKVKRVSVSSKRQISIPKEFFDELQLGSEIQMELYENRLIIKPFVESWEDYSSEILADLVKEGYSGDHLLDEFEYRKAQIPKAMKDLTEDAKKEAEEASIEDLFEEDEDV
jgi:bifunctional DNA-binding transcriptional regulator/antitoxin component of YhaV-PrlF toxin-antitoxin module